MAPSAHAHGVASGGTLRATSDLPNPASHTIRRTDRELASHRRRLRSQGTKCEGEYASGQLIAGPSAPGLQGQRVDHDPAALRHPQPSAAGSRKEPGSDHGLGAAEGQSILPRFHAARRRDRPCLGGLVLGVYRLQAKGDTEAVAAAGNAAVADAVFDGVVKLRVLTDMSSYYSDLSRPSSVLATKTAEPTSRPR